MIQRSGYIDTAKGLLIILVVFGHVWRAIYNNRILTSELWYERIDGWIYSFHMPAFFFLAGVLALKSASCSSLEFVMKKLRTIAYPYLVWSILQTGFQILMVGSTTHVATLADIIKIPFVPVMQFWFLYALFFMYLIFIILKQFGNSRTIYFIFALFLSIVLRFGSIPYIPVIVYVSQYFVYFSIGIICSGIWEDNKLFEKKGHLAIVTICSALLSMLPVSGCADIPIFFNDWSTYIFALPGGVMIMCGAILITGSCKLLNRLLSLIGRKSLEIFVAHVFFLAGYRVGLIKLLHINDVWLHLIGGWLVGLAGPIILAYLSYRFQFRYLFSWPRAGIATISKAN